MSAEFDPSKRSLILAAGQTGLIAAGGLMVPLAGEAVFSAAADDKTADRKQVEVTPPEDLMREHGVLDRVLLVYEAAIRKFGAGEDFDPAVLSDAATIVREFIQNYHEQEEEDEVFPRFKKAGEMVPLIETLLVQHRVGRRLTDTILQSARGSRKRGEEREHVVTAMRRFIAMYRPHAAHEDTDLFPKLKTIVTANEYDSMAEGFEKKEHELFGEDGFEKIIARVADLERKLGIDDLNKFTPI